MARGRKYGKTWWGGAWVEALEEIDIDTNRLPRGRSYANGGRVSSIKVADDGTVKAAVQGTRSSPYRVEIRLSRFSEREKNSIKSSIAEDPVLESELSLGRLPEKILEPLAEKGIFLLPRSWKEISARCSCPDWANPCKHLAAVYYILANEIDKDPLILFKLRGLKAGELLETADLALAREQENHTLPGADHNRRPIVVPYQEVSIAAECSLKEQQSAQKDFPVDLSSIAKSRESEAVFTLLGESPLFYPEGNFKTMLLKAYRNIAAAMEKLELLDDVPSLEDAEFTLLYPSDKLLETSAGKKHQDGSLLAEYSLFIGGVRNKKDSPWGEGEEKTLSVPQEGSGKLVLKRNRGRLLPLEAVFDLFLALPLTLSGGKGSLGGDFLSAATTVAQALARSSSFVPVVRSLDGEGGRSQGRFCIFYRPLDRSGRLDEAVQYLAAIMPPGLIYCQGAKGVLAGKEAVGELLALILTYIARRFAGLEVPNKVCRAFFGGEYYLPEKFEEEQTAKAVSDWLAWLNLESARISPVIKVGLPAPGKEKFKLRLSVEDKRDPLAPVLPLSDVFSDWPELYGLPIAAVRREVSRQLTVAGEHIPLLKKLLSYKGKKFANITPEEMAVFFTEGQQICSLLGIRVIVPRELKKLAAPQVSLTAKTAGEQGEGVSFFNLDQMVDFSWRVAIGDSHISREEFMELVQSAAGVVRFKEQYLLLRPEEVKGIIAKLESLPPRLSAMETLRATITGEAEETRFDPDEVLQRLANDLTVEQDVTLPAGIEAELRPYQKRGFSWLYANTVKGLGSCLADDMGLGKTIQVITLVLKLKEEGWLTGPVLVVCPTTLIGNWAGECARFAPSLKVAVYHGSERRLSVKGLDLIVTSYGTLRRDSAKFRRGRWDLLVIDEAQNIKNPESAQAKAVKSIEAKGYIAMSGTPVENRLMELWSIFDFINRGYLGKRQEFASRFALPIEKYREEDRIRKLKQAAAPFLLRRLKSDKSIISDLPDKIINNEYCYLSREQAALYQQVITGVMQEIEQSEGIARKGLVFKLITALKQICNHPVQYTKKGQAEKEHSGKAEKILALLEKILADGEKALVFTQYREMGELLVKMIKYELRTDVLFFHGGLPRKKRDEFVEEFQSDSGSKVMIISLKAGGTGLNLTAAANVIHYDLWWNPAVEDQATDRAYRIGQTKKVTVHRLISLGTFEEKIDAMINAKKELAELTVAAGESRLSELSNEELREIFRLET